MIFVIAASGAANKKSFTAEVFENSSSKVGYGINF